MAPARAHDALLTRSGGSFLLRVEDTDAGRTVAGAEARLKRALVECGLGWDGAAVRQSERLERYRGVGRGLEDAGLAYACFCSRERLDGLRKD